MAVPLGSIIVNYQGPITFFFFIASLNSLLCLLNEDLCNMQWRVEHADAFFVEGFVFTVDAFSLQFIRHHFWYQKETFLTRTHLSWAEAVSVSGVWGLTTAADGPHGSQHSTGGIVECASWPGFLFDGDFLQNSLSWHYFWIVELDRGQLFLVCIIICLTCILDTSSDFREWKFSLKIVS